MRNRKPESIKLFAHREDEAFRIITSLEALFARMFPARGSRWLRIRLQKASARLAEMLIVAAGEDEPSTAGVNVKSTLTLCRVIDGILKLLSHYDVLSFRDYEEAVRLAVRLTKVVALRFFGIKFDGNDGSPSSSSSAEFPEVVSDLAAQSPPPPG